MNARAVMVVGIIFILAWCCLGCAEAMAAQKRNPDLHVVHKTIPPNLYDASFAACGATESCTETFTDKFGAESVPGTCCTLLVFNGDGIGNDEVLSFDIFLNGKKVASVRGRSNVRTHVMLRRKNKLKVV